MIGTPEYAHGHENGKGLNTQIDCKSSDSKEAKSDTNKIIQGNYTDSKLSRSEQNSDLFLDQESTNISTFSSNDSGFGSSESSSNNSPQESPCPSETSSARIPKDQMNSNTYPGKLDPKEVEAALIQKADTGIKREDQEKQAAKIALPQQLGSQDVTKVSPPVCVTIEESNPANNQIPTQKCEATPQVRDKDVKIQIDEGNLLDVPSKSTKSVNFTFADESGSENGSVGSPSRSQSEKHLPAATPEGQGLLDESTCKKEDEIEEVKDQKCTVKGSVTLALRILRVIATLFFFICSLDLLSSSFQLLGGRAAGAAFRNSELLRNPVCGLMLGVVATAVLQSSSTSTSIVTTMVASQLLSVPVAIPIIMGANIGTSITGVIVSVAQAGDVSVFKRAFSAATVHDTFNWLTVFVLLPIEIACGMLYRLTTAIVNNANLAGTGATKQEFLRTLTKPITKLVIQLDKSVLEAVAKGNQSVANKTLRKDCSGKLYVPILSSLNATGMNTSFTTTSVSLGSTTPPATYSDIGNASALGNISLEMPVPTMVIQGKPKCWYIFQSSVLNDQAVGAILLILALALLMLCLTFMVRDLKALLAGQMAKVIQKRINADFPGKAKHLTGYAFILLGAILTVLVQSSSVVVSTLTPLVGVKFVTLPRVFPMMLGANLGTTSTAILAAFASTGNSVRASLQIALCHLFFNLIGIIVWYPVPFMRKIPLGVARYLGKTTAVYKWFAFLYLITGFFIIPLSVFGLSMLGWQVLAAVGIPILALILFILIINILQHYKQHWLPEKLQTWEFLPEFMRSLRPLDNVIRRICASCPCCKRCCQTNNAEYGAISRNTTMTSLGSVVDSLPVSPAQSACPSANPSPSSSRKLFIGKAKQTSPVTSQV